MTTNTVIIGANRGIGLALAQQYTKRGDNVIATCRNTSNELSQLSCTIIENIDISDDALSETIATQIPVNHIDILIHNSGILQSDTIDTINLDSMREHFEVNSLGPLRTILGLQSKLGAGSKVGIVSSRVGSIDDNESSNNYAYRVSKTAVNMIGKCLSIDFKDKAIALALLHPGYVQTEMTNSRGLINTHDSAAGLIKQMDELTLNTSGIFVHTNGEKLPW